MDERNKTSVDNVCTKLDKLNEIMMKMQEEHERLKGLVNTWEVKQKVMGQKCDFMDEWRRRNNISIFGIEEYPLETYFDTLKITEDILKTKVKVEIVDWRIEKVHRLGRSRGNRLILVSFTSSSKKIEVGLLQAKQKLTGTKIRIAEDFSIKVRETCQQLIPYMIDAKSKGNIAFLRKDKLVVNRKIFNLDFVKENYMIRLNNRRLDTPTTNHCTSQ
jgi:hypothetical protein